MYGADSHQLRAIAREMARSADELDSGRSFLSRLLFDVPWLGDIASAFLERWTGICVPNLTRSIAFLREAAENLTRQANEQDAASADDGRSGASVRPGDLGGAYSWERAGSWSVDGATAEERGRRVLQRMLDHIFDERIIAPDEFEIVKLDNGKYLVVLPGVADLEAWGKLFGGDISSRPFGFDPTHRSVRDTDAVAVASATDASVGNNLYAQYVMRSMEAYGVPPGAEVTLVGHSLGGDTALDLAADPNFNGANGYRVTHVLAAAYNSEHQLPSVPHSTEVLVIQNSGDRVVAAERGLFGPTMIFNGRNEIDRGIYAGDPMQVISGVRHSLQGVHQTLSDVASQGDEFLANAVANGPRAAGQDLLTLDEGTYSHGPNHDRIVFHGGSSTEDFGHSSGRYAAYVGSTDDAAFRRFAESLARAGYDANGTRTLHDVSVPE